jgi:hypothetical protein
LSADRACNFLCLAAANAADGPLLVPACCCCCLLLLLLLLLMLLVEVM